MFSLIGGAALWAALCGGVGAADFTFGALGDTPYTRFEEAHFPGLLAGMNREDLAFVVHVGDFKSASAPCSDELFRQRREWFDRVRHPFVFVPGDNEWTDCRRCSRRAAMIRWSGSRNCASCFPGARRVSGGGESGSRASRRIIRNTRAGVTGTCCS